MPNYKWFIDEAQDKTKKIISDTGFSIDEINSICDSVESIANRTYRNTDRIPKEVKAEFGSDRLEHVLYWITREATEVYQAIYTENIPTWEVNDEVVTGTPTLCYESIPKLMNDRESFSRRIKYGVHKYKRHISYRMKDSADEWRKLGKKPEPTGLEKPTRTSSLSL